MSLGLCERDIPANKQWKFRPSSSIPWASYQIRKIVGGACVGNAGNVFPTTDFQGKPLVSDPGIYHGTCVTHVPWCMSGSLTYGGGENVPGISGAWATWNFTYLARSPWMCRHFKHTIMTSTNGNIFRVTGPLGGNSPVTGEFPSQRPVTQIFDIFFDLRLNKWLGEQSRRRWFETPSRSLLRHCNL